MEVSYSAHRRNMAHMAQLEHWPVWGQYGAMDEKWSNKVSADTDQLPQAVKARIQPIDPAANPIFGPG